MSALSHGVTEGFRRHSFFAKITSIVLAVADENICLDTHVAASGVGAQNTPALTILPNAVDPGTTYKRK